MISITYSYDNKAVLSYNRRGGEEKDIVLPRQDEFVVFNDIVYRVETTTHGFLVEGDELNQYITLKLTKQLAVRNIS